MSYVYIYSYDVCMYTYVHVYEYVGGSQPRRIASHRVASHGAAVAVHLPIKYEYEDFILLGQFRVRNSWYSYSRRGRTKVKWSRMKKTKMARGTFKLIALLPRAFEILIWKTFSHKSLLGEKWSTFYISYLRNSSYIFLFYSTAFIFHPRYSMYFTAYIYNFVFTHGSSNSSGL